MPDVRLVIAKIARQLQQEDAPKFQNVFIALGGFHIQMTALAVFGKYIAEAGGPNILNKCHITEKGPLKSFISGKGYKRSNRAHHLLVLAREVYIFNLL